MGEFVPISFDERLCRLIVDASPAGMIIASGEGKIVMANRQAQEQFGYTRQEMLGQDLEMLLPPVHRQAHISHRARYTQCPVPRTMAGGRDLFAQRKDGKPFPVDISLHPLQTDGGLYVLAHILDATDRRRAEQEREARQAMERLALLGQLAGSVAHEIRTPLCVIRNDAYYLGMLAEQLGPEGRDCIQEINDAVGKANRIVSELLDFTRDPPGQPAPVAVARIIAAAVQDVGLPASVTLIRPTVDEALQINVDPEQIERALINLLRNASQATDDRGRIEIRVGADERTVWLEVADSGPGIEAEFLERVFEPLFTTKPKGIGLGLAVSRRYAQRNGGSLNAANRSEGGACFRLTLPRLPAGSTGGEANERTAETHLDR